MQPVPLTQLRRLDIFLCDATGNCNISALLFTNASWPLSEFLFRDTRSQCLCISPGDSPSCTQENPLQERSPLLTIVGQSLVELLEHLAPCRVLIALEAPQEEWPLLLHVELLEPLFQRRDTLLLQQQEPRADRGEAAGQAEGRMRPDQSAEARIPGGKSFDCSLNQGKAGSQCAARLYLSGPRLSLSPRFGNVSKFLEGTQCIDL